jgi:hypothetical protein
LNELERRAVLGGYASRVFRACNPSWAKRAKGGVYRGRDEIDRIAGAVKATHPDFRYQPIAEPDEVGDGGRVQWVSGRPGEAPAYTGTDASLSETAGLPTFISFSTSYPELDSAA